MDHYGKAIELLDYAENAPDLETAHAVATAALAHATLAAAPRPAAIRSARAQAAATRKSRRK